MALDGGGHEDSWVSDTELDWDRVSKFDDLAPGTGNAGGEK